MIEGLIRFGNGDKFTSIHCCDDLDGLFVSASINLLLSVYDSRRRLEYVAYPSGVIRIEGKDWQERAFAAVPEDQWKRLPKVSKRALLAH